MFGRSFKIAERIRELAQRSWLARWSLRIAALLVVFGLGGFLVAVSGIVSIKASSRHGAMTHWFLQFSKERSVATHAQGVKRPPLDEPWLVLKGAGHYEIGCRPCHGSPEYQHPRITQRMNPTPPWLPQTVSTWEPEELFYIVKHGIKFTGMPSWPSQKRDDEVWAIVAFLRAFPNLDVEEYRALVNESAAPDAEISPGEELEPHVAPSAVAKSCMPCHGANGRGREVAAFPKLAGQRSDYFAASLEAYARGERHSGIMEPIAAGLSSRQISELARHYENLQSVSRAPSSQQSADSVERGKEIAELGIPNREVPACIECHGPGDVPRNSNYPLLAGQHADYLALQLRLFQQEQRGGTTSAHLMRRVTAGMNFEQMRDVADYYASLEPASGSRESEAP